LGSERYTALIPTIEFFAFAGANEAQEPGEYSCRDNDYLVP
jgi:hypothetical protein